MINLNEFIKEPPSKDKDERTVTSSVNLKAKHVRFLKKKKVVLSQLVRRVIDDMMALPENQEIELEFKK